MKKLFLAALSLLAAACSTPNNEIDGNPVPEAPSTPVTLGASCDPGTRTYLDDNLQVRWAADDQLGVYAGDSENACFSIKPEYAGNAYAEFTGTITGSPAQYIAYYPYDEHAVIGYNTQTHRQILSLPTLCDEHGVLSGLPKNLPSVAFSQDEELYFRNVCGLLKFTVKTSMANGIYLKNIFYLVDYGTKYGGFESVAVLFDEGLDDGDEPVVETGEGVGYKRLHIGKNDNGEMVRNRNSSGGEKYTAKTFYMKLPPHTAPSFILTFTYTDAGDPHQVERTYTIKSDKPLTLNRSTILNMGTFELGSYTEGEHITIGEQSGVVYDVADNGDGTKTVSVLSDEEYESFYYNGVQIPNLGLGGLSNNDGYSNTIRVQQCDGNTYDGGNIVLSRDFPAFYWCQQLGKDWYIPGLEEWKEICRHWETVEAESATSIKYKTYWSSNQYQITPTCENKHYFTGISANTPNSIAKFRAISKFQLK